MPRVGLLVAPLTRAGRTPAAKVPFVRSTGAPQLVRPRRPLSLSHCRRAAVQEGWEIPRDNLSIVHGSTVEPLDERTLYQCWRDVVQANADRPALVCRKEGVRWTFREFDERIAALARGLYQAGLRKGDRLGVWLGNRSEHQTAIWAAAKLGVVLVSLNPAYRGDDILYALNRSGCKGLIVAPTMRQSDYVSILLEALPSLATSEPHKLDDPAAPELRSIFLIDNTPGDGSYEPALARSPALVRYDSLLLQPSPELDARVDESTNAQSNTEISGIQFSSGTTARAKAIGLTHRNVLNNGIHIGQHMRITNRDILLNTPPLFHCFGLVLGNLAIWTHGACIVMANESFDPAADLRAMVEERCTARHGVPIMWIATLNVLEAIRTGQRADFDDLKLDFSALRTGIAAGSPVPGPLMSKLSDPENGFGLTELTITYGMTETSPASFMSFTDDPVQKRIDTVGRVLPHVSAKVVDPLDADAKPLPLNTDGELLVRGYNVSPGYYNDPEATKTLFRDDPDGTRWLVTGDIAAIDEDGFLHINGRIKDLIIRGGENLSPLYIESLALRLDGVSDASVIGVPDPTFGEVVGVFIQRKDTPAGAALTADAVRKHVKQLNPQGTPAYVWFLGEDGAPASYPATVSGKIRKVELRGIAKTLAGIKG